MPIKPAAAKKAHIFGKQKSRLYIIAKWSKRRRGVTGLKYNTFLIGLREQGLTRKWQKSNI